MIPQDRIQKFKDQTFSKENVMIPQERVNEAAKEFNPNNNNLLDTGFRSGVRFAEAELQKPDTDKAEFVRYCKEARTEFVVKFWEYHKGDPLERVMAEDLLIAYDQLLNRYNHENEIRNPIRMYRH